MCTRWNRARRWLFVTAALSSVGAIMRHRHQVRTRRARLGTGQLMSSEFWPRQLSGRWFPMFPWEHFCPGDWIRARLSPMLAGTRREDFNVSLLILARLRRREKVFFATFPVLSAWPNTWT